LPLSSHFNDALGVLVIVAFGRSCAFPAARQCRRTALSHHGRYEKSRRLLSPQPRLHSDGATMEN
jgi:hypothetical protein